MNENEIEQGAIDLIDEFSANVAEKSLLLAISHEIDDLAIRAVLTDGIVKVRAQPTQETLNIVLGHVLAFGAFLQHKGRFDIMKLRGTIQ